MLMSNQERIIYLAVLILLILITLLISRVISRFKNSKM